MAVLPTLPLQMWGDVWAPSEKTQISFSAPPPSSPPTDLPLLWPTHSYGRASDCGPLSGYGGPTFNTHPINENVLFTSCPSHTIHGLKMSTIHVASHRYRPNAIRTHVSVCIWEKALCDSVTITAFLKVVIIM